MSLALASARGVISPRLFRREGGVASSVPPPASLLQAEDLGDSDDFQQEVPDQEAKSVKMLQDLMDVESDMAEDFTAKAKGNVDTNNPIAFVDEPSSSQDVVSADPLDATAGMTDPNSHLTAALRNRSREAGLVASAAATKVDTSLLPTTEELADVSSFELNPAIHDIWTDVASGDALGTARAKRRKAMPAQQSRKSGSESLTMLSATQDDDEATEEGTTGKKHKSTKKDAQHARGKRSGKLGKYRHKSRKRRVPKHSADGQWPV
jgi:hypothetical protein